MAKKGFYLISIFYFKFPIFFIVINLILSVSNSNCKLEINPKSSDDKTKKIIYSCTFKGENNDEINVVDSKRYHNLKINTYLNRNDEFLKSMIGTCDKSKCIYSIQLDIIESINLKQKLDFMIN